VCSKLEKISLALDKLARNYHFEVNLASIFRLSGATCGQFPTFPLNIGLAWKSLPETNTFIFPPPIRGEEKKV
jgi:hypothetical protein